MDGDIVAPEIQSPSSNHHNENGVTNGYTSEKHRSKSEHKDKHRDKDRDRDHKSSRSKDHKSSKDKDRHHSSSRDKGSSHKSSSRDKEKDRHRDKDKSKDKDRHKSSSSAKDKEHKSPKEHKSSSKDKDKDKERSSKDHKDKERSKDKDKDRHRHSSSSGKDKHRDKARPRDKDKDKDRKDRKSDKYKDDSPEKLKTKVKDEIDSQANGNYDDDDEKKLFIKEENDDDDKKLVIKDEYEEDSCDKANNSQASSCDYNLSQFKDESKFEGVDDPEPEQDDEQIQVEEEEDSEEDVPLLKRLENSKRKYVESDEDEKPPVKVKKSKKSKSKKRAHSDNDDEEEDFKPVKKEKKTKAAVSKGSVKKEESISPKKKKKAEDEQEVWKWWEEEKRDDGTKWKFLEHKGPVFAPLYERIPSNVKFLYDGKEMHLSEEAEEVAGFYAKMLDHDYTTKEVFNNNFFKDWRKCMTDEERKKITDLKKCNFKKMHAYFMDVAEKNRNRTKEEKLALKEKNEEILKEYGYCTIDGHKERIGNFKIEPPGLFRGRGEHPKMGMLKKRLRPEDVLINCSKDSQTPKPPSGHKWKEVRHDPSVTWLCSWTENVQNQVKYIMLNPSSKLKGEKDWQKYETARRLHKCIDKIRSEYKDDWKSKEMRIRQRAVALYFIDKLALRAGNEKDEDQADTVGCCSLRVEHIQLHEKRDDKEYVVVFDFLGKDSIRYYNEVPVEKRVFKNLQLFMENKAPGDDLFDRLNTTVMNKHLMELMDGLTAKVFRTYNASITLQQQLDKLTNADDSLSEKILAYNRANRAVAILCNHQRAVPKGHAKSMEKLKEKIDAKREQIKDAERSVKDAQRDAKHGSVKEKTVFDQKKKQLAKMKEQLTKLEIQETDRDENKTIALGTSKLNYLDPRISVAWCKKYEVPLEKIYNKTQRDKFRWAIDMAGPDYIF